MQSTAEIVDDSMRRAPDRELVELLRRVYVGGGFTDPDVAAIVFTPETIRARGRLLCAYGRNGALVGTVIVVPPESAARRLASLSEAEMHLLAVDDECRGQGIGHALVRVAVEAAQRAGYQGMVLWTQPAMHAARHVYEQNGFVRSPLDDFERDGRTFHVYRRRFEGVLQSKSSR